VKVLLLMGGGVAVIAAIVVLVLIVADRPPASGQARAGAAEPTTASPGVHRMAGGGTTPDAATLPTPEEEAEARARVLAEYRRPPNLSPDVVKSNQTVKPMREARDAYADGDFPLALDRAQDVLALDPRDRQARMYAAMAACGLGEVGIAQAHADKMEPAQKVRAAAKCKKHGVTLANVPVLPAD
jgi:hypothetical protein